MQPTTDACAPLHVRWFERHGYLAAGGWGHVDGAPGVCWHAERGGLRVFDTAGDADRSMLLRVTRDVRADGTARVWWECPACGRRAVCLYRPPAGGLFICRPCHESAHRANTLRAPW
jgi:hypothetical protein